jgi:hypothetical protein
VVVSIGGTVRRLVPLIVLVLLASTPVAKAKELPVEVCGAGGCVTVSDRGLAGFLHSTGAPGVAPDPAPFYVVRFRSGAGPRSPIAWSYLYVPSASAMRGNEFGSGPVRWMRASFLAPEMAELTKDLEPYPASPTWTPSTSARDEGFPVGWVALGALAGVALAALALRRLGTFLFTPEARVRAPRVSR